MSPKKRALLITLAVIAMGLFVTGLKVLTTSPDPAVGGVDYSATAVAATTSAKTTTSQPPYAKPIPLPWTDFSQIINRGPIGAAAVNESTGVAAVWSAGRLYTASLTDAMIPDAAQTISDNGGSVSIIPATTGGVRPGTKYTSGVPTAAGATGGFPWPILIFGLLAAGMLALFTLPRIRRAKSAAAEAKKEKAEQAERPTVTFADVAGCEEAIEDMIEVVDYLKNPEPYSRVGARVPKGALLCGPPGTGKTLLARAVAGEAGVGFINASGSDFVDTYVGVGAKRVRELFEKARKTSEELGGCIIFIDEIDSIGRKRGSGQSSGGNLEHEGTLNALLVELDGFKKDEKIIIIGATNRDDLLDPALLRPGRLSRKVHVGLPDRVAREKILAVHARKRPLAEDTNLTLIARRTPGMSGAELEAIINEAAMIVARAARNEITESDLDEAVAVVAMGKARLSAVMSEDDRVLTAWHEAGHAVVALVLPDATDPVSISVIPRGNSGGATWFPESDAGYLRRKEALARMAVGMGGRAAEEMLLGGEFTTGPSGDLQQVSNIALQMVTNWGMTDNGLIVKSGELLGTGAALTDSVIAEAEALAADALETARAALRDNKELFDRFVAELLEWDTLTQSQIEQIVEGEVMSAPQLAAPPVEYRKERAPVGSDARPAAVPFVPTPVPAPGRKKGGLVGRLAGALGAKLLEHSRAR